MLKGTLLMLGFIEAYCVFCYAWLLIGTTVLVDVCLCSGLGLQAHLGNNVSMAD